MGDQSSKILQGPVVIIEYRHPDANFHLDDVAFHQHQERDGLRWVVLVHRNKYGYAHRTIRPSARELQQQKPSVDNAETNTSVDPCTQNRG